MAVAKGGIRERGIELVTNTKEGAMGKGVEFELRVGFR